MKDDSIKSVFASQVSGAILSQWLALGVTISSFVEDYDESASTCRALIAIAERFYEMCGASIDDTGKADLWKVYMSTRERNGLSTDSILELEII